MPRARRVRRLFPIALSPTELWEALGGAVSQRAIIRAIKDGACRLSDVAGVTPCAGHDASKSAARRRRCLATPSTGKANGVVTPRVAAV